MNLPIVLGSTSVYRRDLLARLGIAFVTAKPDVDETPLADEAPAAIAARLAHAKALRVAALHPEKLVIGADQTASFMDAVGREQLIGKPGTRAAAIRQLTAMSGANVVFHSAMCIVRPGFSPLAESVPTTVTFRELTAAEIERYVDRESALDCAGSAKVEGLGIALMERVASDDPTALIGLPLIALCRMLRTCGVQVP
jgi:septum formation protein